MTDKMTTPPQDDKSLRSIHEAFDRGANAMNVINGAQQALWELSHQIRPLNEKLGEAVYMWSLQIEYALKILNEEIFAGEGYWKNER